MKNYLTKLLSISLKSGKGVSYASRRVALTYKPLGFLGKMPAPMLCCESTMLRKRPYRRQQLSIFARGLLPLLLCYGAFQLRTTPVAAQSITPATDGTGTIINHNGNTYNIGGGTQAGANLFHSFVEFGLNPDEVANFLSNPQIDNILGRVTGGNASVIQGLIQLTGSNSNLYLMNPNGWVFHQGASLDVPGSFGVTTATRMGFGNGYFNADGANVYSNLTGNPTSLIFDTDNPSWIINEADLAVNSDASLWAVGGGIVSTGTINAGEITLAAVPGNNQVRLSHEGMVLNLVLDAAPAGGSNHNITGIQSVDIPRYLTGGSEVGHVNYAVINADGTVNLVNRDTVIENGDTVIAGGVNGDEITLMAAGKVKPTDYDLVSSHPVVVLFPEAIGDNLETTFIDEGINDYQGEDAYHDFLYGGKPGTISQIVTHDEGEGIGTVTRMLAAIAQQGGKVSAIHLLTEGNEGNFWLGRDYVDSENIGEYQQELEQWKGALTTGADILLYSCFTALGVTGMELITSLANYTGADVAASTDLTGSEALGGNWVFEKQVGTIEAGLGFESQVLADFTGKLQVFTAGNDLELIAAITTANGNAEADTINLTGDITLTAVDNTDPIDGNNGLPSITADGGNKLTIDGMGNTIARDAAAPNFRILHIAAGAEVELNNTTISGGEAAGIDFPDSSGGGIFNRGTLTLNDSTVSGNTAVVNGGGIRAYGEVTLNGSTVSGNTTNLNGGGIYANGEVTLNGSTVSGNTTEREGGGIRADGGVTLTNSTVSDNTAGSGGGGIFANGGVTLTNSTVSGNTAVRRGGGIRAYGRVTLTNSSTVSGNTAEREGGGIYAYAGVTLTDSIVSDNTAESDGGGGIFTFGEVTLTNSTVSGNTADSGGGGIFGSGVTLTNSTVSGNTANLNGGGIYTNGEVTLTNSTVSGNTADSGGGIFGSRVTLTNSTVSGNTADSGGGIDVYGTYNHTIVNSIIADNTGPDISGDLSNSDIQFSLIQNTAGITAGAPIDGVNGNIVGVDPQLLDLGDYGGPTQTHALSPNSPALNAGSDALAVDFVSGAILTTDQRSQLRISGIVDIGAFESQLTLTLADGNNQNATVNTSFNTNLQVTLIDEFGNVVPGANITFTPAVGGASGNFLGSNIVATDLNGLATANLLTANTVTGEHTVIATLGNLKVNFDLTNIAAPVPVVVPDDFTPVVVPDDFTPVVVPDDSTPNIPDFTPIWQSVLEELPEYGLEEFACTTTPVVVINSKVEEITLDEAIETAIQRNQDCQPAGRSN